MDMAKKPPTPRTGFNDAADFNDATDEIKVGTFRVRDHVPFT
jgi:hypothetical protein